jgi:hypothetical protein
VWQQPRREKERKEKTHWLIIIGGGKKKPVSLLNYHTGCVGKTKMLKYKISGVSPIARRH